MWWILIGIVIVVAATCYFVFGRSSSDYDAPGEMVDRQGSALPGDHAQSAAEPGSEDQAVVGDGIIGPGPGTAPPEA